MSDKELLTTNTRPSRLNYPDGSGDLPFYVALCTWQGNELDRLSAERDALKARLQAMMPLFQEARDALTAIPLSSAKLHGLDLSLADRMDDVGIPARWEARAALGDRT